MKRTCFDEFQDLDLFQLSENKGDSLSSAPLETLFTQRPIESTSESTQEKSMQSTSQTHPLPSQPYKSSPGSQSDKLQSSSKEGTSLSMATQLKNNPLSPSPSDGYQAQKSQPSLATHQQSAAQSLPSQLSTSVSPSKEPAPHSMQQPSARLSSDADHQNDTSYLTISDEDLLQLLEIEETMTPVNQPAAKEDVSLNLEVEHIFSSLENTQVTQSQKPVQSSLCEDHFRLTQSNPSNGVDISQVNSSVLQSVLPKSVNPTLSLDDMEDLMTDDLKELLYSCLFANP